jgi:hypothetical protein
MRHTHWYWATVMVLGVAASVNANAQEGISSAAPSPTIVQSRDETGRRPFQQSIDNGTCEEAPTCGVTFKKVPSHTRLVITRYNAAVSSVSIGASNFTFSTLSGASNGVTNTFLHSVPTPGISFVNEGTLMFFEAGQAPVAQVTNPAGLLDVRVTISGYLIHHP